MAGNLPSSLRRFLLAGLVAPVVGGVWAGIFFTVILAASSEAYQWPPTFAVTAGLVAFYAAIIALLLTWTIGLIWHVAAYTNGWRSFAAYAGFGGCIAVVSAIAIYSLSGSDWTLTTWLGVLWFSSTGAIVGGTGWLIRRPDRDAPNLDRAAP